MSTIVKDGKPTNGEIMLDMLGDARCVAYLF